MSHITLTNTVSSVAGKTGSVSLVKGDVGLSNVDNTSDAAKPVSTATAAAIAALNGTFAPLASPAFTGSPTADGTALAKVTEAPLSPYRYGAKFDGTTDDTAALQSFLDALFGASGGEGRMPPGVASLNGTLLIRPSADFFSVKLTGSGRPNRNLSGRATYIRQDGGNLPIFKFTKQVAGATFSDFGVGYPSPVGTSATASVGFHFDQPSVGAGTNPQWFSNTFERLTVLNAYDMWKLVTNSGQQAGVWSTYWRTILGDNIQNSGWSLKPSAATGQPICTWRDIYINNANGSVVATAPIFDLAAVEAHMSGLDLEGWRNQIIKCGGGYNTSIDGMHVEHHSVDGTTGNAYQICSVASGYMKIRNASFAGTSLGGQFGITGLVAAQSAGDVADIDGVSTAFSSVTGSLYACLGGSGGYRLGDVKASSGVALSVDTNTARRTVRLDGALGIVKPGTQVTGSRPSASAAGRGAMFYDETLGKPIWSNGSAWTDAAGTTV